MHEEFLQQLYRLPITFVFIIVLFRFVGNQELGKSTPLDLTYWIILIGIAQTLAMDTKYAIWEAGVMMLVITALVYIIKQLTYRKGKAKEWVEGKPKQIIKDGQVNQEIMHEEKINQMELEKMLRVHGVFDIDEVEIAYLEFDGQLSVKRKEKEE